MNEKFDVAIIGGGVAGITAYNYLVQRNFKVCLIEARDSLGGRINSFIDKTTSDEIDNGQHLLIGAYKEFLDLVNDLNSTKFLKILNHIDFKLYSKDKRYHLKSKLNGKWGYLLAILNLNKIDILDKVRIVKLFVMINFISAYKFDDYSCYEFLKKNNQSDKIIKIFWEPLILATLNNNIYDAPAKLLINVLKLGFLSNSQNSKLIFSKVGLTKLIEPIEKKIFNNSKIFKSTRVKKIINENNKIIRLLLNNGEYIIANSFISTVLPIELKKMNLDSNIEKFNFFDGWEYSSVLSIYLWYDGDIFDFDFIGVIDSPIHWIFNRREIFEDQNIAYPNLISIIISSANELINLNSNEILDLVREEILNILPEIKNRNLLHFRIIKEKFATLKIDKSVEKSRPNNNTNFSNLFIAGDWTNTDLPATIESAALSGKKSAIFVENYLKNLKE